MDAVMSFLGDLSSFSDCFCNDLQDVMSTVVFSGVDWAVLGSWLDSMILIVFSSQSEFMILSVFHLTGLKARLQELACRVAFRAL